MEVNAISHLLLSAISRFLRGDYDKLNYSF